MIPINDRALLAADRQRVFFIPLFLPAGLRKDGENEEMSEISK